MAAVTGVLVNSGASLVLATVMVKTWLSVAIALSSTCNSTLWSPTSSLVGVPLRVALPSPLSVRVSQVGKVGAVMVSKSPASMSVAVMW